MYEWRQMTARQREEALRVRRQCRRPWHSPPHFPADFPSFFHLSAACYEHAPLIGQTPARMAERPVRKRLYRLLTQGYWHTRNYLSLFFG